MNELVKLGKKTYVLKNPVNVGIYLLNDKEVCLIDTGSSKDYAKTIDKILIEHNWTLKYIINTHGHADHISGNKYLQDKYNCEIYSSRVESYFINEPIFEPTLMYGADAIKDLKNRYLLAKASICKDISGVQIDGIDIIDLKGHSLGSIGVVTDDLVCFAGDSYTSEKILQKYAIQYTFDINNYLDTINFLLSTHYNYYVPAHGDIEENPKSTLEKNMQNILNIEDQILEILNSPKTFNELLSELCNIYHIKMNFLQYHLIGSTLKSFLTKLEKALLIRLEYENGFMIIYKNII